MRKRMPSKWLTLIAACFGLLMLYIDLFIVNVALPTIVHDFRAPLGTVSWTISGYVLMIGVLPMGIGRLGALWAGPGYHGFDRHSCNPGHWCGYHDAWYTRYHHSRFSSTPARPGYWNLWRNLRPGSHRGPGPWWTARSW